MLFHILPLQNTRMVWGIFSLWWLCLKVTAKRPYPNGAIEWSTFQAWASLLWNHTWKVKDTKTTVELEVDSQWHSPLSHGSHIGYDVCSLGMKLRRCVLGPGCTRGQNYFCWSNILLKFLFPVKNYFGMLGSHQFTVMSTNVSTTETLIRAPAKSESRYHVNKNMEPRHTAFTLLGILCLLTCMRVRMASIFSMQCIYCLHNLNIQMALLNHERQNHTMQMAKPSRD